MTNGQQPTVNTIDERSSKVESAKAQRTVDSRFLSQPSPSDYPRAWYHFATEKELRHGPVTKHLLGKHLVGFLTKSGAPGVLSNRCAHMGSDLGNGCVVNDSIQCSLHHWEFATDGRCTNIPSNPQADAVPGFARQQSFPAVRRQGSVYFFNGKTADHPLPFFAGIEPDQLVAAKPFVEYVDCPWYMIGANAVDLQHFEIAHDRQLQSDPVVDYPDPLAHRTECHFSVAGKSVADQFTKRFGGVEVRLGVTDWCSTIILAHSRLKRTETFGLVAVTPISSDRTMAHVTVMAHASAGPVGRALVDPMRAFVRRLLIRAFLRNDIDRLSGTRFSPDTLIGIDQPFAEYFDWLATIIRRPAE